MDLVDVTELLFAENVALVAPAGTVTASGTVAAELLLESETTAPTGGAAELSTTVP